MGKATSIIELNGQRFNARTGVAIDGMRPVRNMLATKIQRKQPVVDRVTTPSNHIHKTAQPSKTLMRHAVKKPSTITNRVTIAMDVVQHIPGDTVAKVFHTANPDRSMRAHSVHKLSNVSHFRTVEPSMNAAHAPQQPTLTSRPPVPTERATAAVPAPPYVMSKTNKLLDKGMRAATSHTSVIAKKQKLRHRIGSKFGLSKRATSLSASALTVLALGAFFTYQNIPNINVRYAAAKSGVRATIPGYQPAGFAVNNHVQFSPGELTIAYKANADSRSYTLSQRNTSWDSVALKDHLATVNGSTPMSYPDSGRTIYLHDDSAADWVQGGVWYSITGNSSLNTDQLIKIATSI